MSVWADMRLNPPTFPTPSTIRVSVVNAPTNSTVTVYYTPTLGSGWSWTSITNGTTGQTNFDLARSGNTAFYCASYSLVSAPFHLDTPSFPAPSTIRLTAENAPTNAAVVIYQTLALTNPLVWTSITTGMVAQTMFDLAKPTNPTAFYRASYFIPQGQGGPTLPTVTVQATVPVGSETGNPCVFTVTRAGTDSSGDLPVSFQLGGSAAEGSDFQPVGSQVTILANQTSATVTIHPYADNIVNVSNKTVVLNLLTNVNYSVGNPANATASILDGPVTYLTIQTTDPNASGTAGDVGVFVIRRSGTNITSALPVNIQVGGTATPGVDYPAIGTNVTIPANASSVSITIQPNNNGPSGTSKTIVLSLQPGPGYGINTPNSATVNVLDPFPTSVGTDFWVLFFALAYNDEGEADQPSLMISSQVATTGTVSIPGISFSQPFSVSAGGMTNIAIPGNAIMSMSPNVQNTGIHITAGQPVAVYGLGYVPTASESYAGFATPLLGTNYCILAYSGTGDPRTVNYPSEFAVVATTNNTTVTITPSPTADLAWFQGMGTITKTLQQGQTIQFMGASSVDDVSGTFISSDKPIAVFSGAYITDIPPTDQYANPLIEEQLPIQMWGKQALGFPLATREGGDRYRVLAAYDGTQVLTNGVAAATLQSGQFCELVINGPVEFRANNPIQVAQYSNSSTYDGVMGDPFQMMLPPAGDGLNSYTIPTPSGFVTNYLNIVVSSPSMAATIVDGNPVPLTAFKPIGTSSYYGAQVSVAAGAHNVHSYLPIAVQVYGFAPYDGYGHMGGVTFPRVLANPDNFTIPLNAPATLDVLANDVFSSRNAILLTIVSGPSHGTFQFDPNKNIIYTPQTDYAGTDYLTYQIQDGASVSTATVSISINNRPPIASDVFTCGASATVIDVLANDYDPDGDALSVIAFTSPTNGTVMFYTNNTLLYTPLTSTNGVATNGDSFVYTISDGKGGTASATVYVWAAPVAVNDSRPVYYQQPKTIQVLANDYDPNGASPSIVSATQGAHGTTAITPDSQAITYSPQAGFTGSDSFTYTITDGQCSDSAIVSITVSTNNHPPVANPQSVTVLRNTPSNIILTGSDPDQDDPLTFTVTSGPSNGSLSGNPPNVVYTPTPGYSGADSFMFKVNDGKVDSAPATVSIQVSSMLPTAAPVLSPGSGSYPVPTDVMISCATPGAAIYYTTNGNDPTKLDTYIYNGSAVHLASSVTLKAKAFAPGYSDGAETTAVYTINAPPFVSAGPQQTTNGSTVTLQGFVSDDGLIGGGTRFTNWSCVSGPPGCWYIYNPSQTNTMVDLYCDGIYVFQLMASDGQYTNSAQVTIARNPTVSVSITNPVAGSTYTVPTNIMLQAQASCSSGTVTQVQFYGNGVLIGQASNTPVGYTLQWKSVPAGIQAITAVAFTSDANNQQLSSAPVPITVNWPTNVGLISFALNDLNVPVAGLPLQINRLYDTGLATNGAFGQNWKLDYETVKIEKNDSLATDWYGSGSGLGYCINDSTQHLVTVSLNNSEKFYFQLRLVFDSDANPCVTSSQVPDCYNFYTVHFVVIPLGPGQLYLAPPGAGVGMDDQLTGWHQPLTAVYFDDSGFPIGTYDPDFSQFTFIDTDGTAYGFNSDGTVASRTDRNGNALFYGDSGINHSTGKQVSFVRDGAGRITEIRDPIALATGGSPVLKYSYSGSGNLTNVAHLVQRSPAIYENTGYAYTNTSFPHYITSITDPRGIVSVRYEYDSQGRVSKQYDALNRYTSYTYDVVNYRQTATDRLTNSTIQSFALSGQITSIQDAAGGLKSYGYDSQGREIVETNALGQATAFAYDANDNLIGSTNQSGSVSNSTYNTFGEVLISVDARGFGTTNAYDPAGNLLFTTNALGIVTAYGYDFQGNMKAQTNALGMPEEVIVLNLFDQYGDLTNTETFDASFTLICQTGFTYDLNGNKTVQVQTRTLPGGGQETLLTQWAYDAANHLIQTIDASGATNRIVYNALDKQGQTIDGLNRTNYYFCDPIGLLTNTTYADGTFEFYGYDAEGHRTSSTDRNNHATTYAFDAVGRLVLTTYPDQSYIQNVYDSSGLLRSTISGPALGSPQTIPIVTAQYDYDAAGRQIAFTNAQNAVIRYAYDPNGNQLTTTDALSRVTSFAYDALNRQVLITYPDYTTQSYGYDALGRRVAVTNQDYVVSRFGYDVLGRLVAATNAFSTPQQMVTRYVYDEVGNMIQQIDGVNHTNRFEYDEMGRRTKWTLPGTQASTFRYDSVGNLIRQTNFNGIIITNQYDSLNRLTNKSSAAGYVVTFLYSPTGQRTNMVDASGTTSYTYDSRDRLLTKATPEGALTYTYDGFGNLATIQSSAPNGTQISYWYDSLNRVTNATDRFASSAVYTYDAAGNLKASGFSNGVTNSYAYSSLNRLTNITVTGAGATIASFAYGLVPGGSRTNLIEMIGGTNRISQWSYDALSRLTNELVVGAYPSGSVSYQYDAVGNRTNRTSTISGVTNQTFSYDSNDQLTTDIYDSNGNTRTNGSNAYFYDPDNRLTSANVAGNGVTITYDGDGNRVRETVGGTTILFLVDDRNPTGYAQVLEELSVSGGITNLSKLYTYGLSLICQRQNTGVTSFYGCDGNGNVRFLTSATGTITDAYTYDAFGTLLSVTGTTPNNYRYTGEQFDPNLGFYSLRARYMNPNTGRFLNRDPYDGNIFDPPSLHKYLYAQNNPVNLNDPSGKQIGGVTEILAVVTIIVVLSALYMAALVGARARVGRITWEENNTYRILYHYSALSVLSGSQIYSGTFLTDNANLTASQAQLGLGIRGALPTTLFAINVQDTEIAGGTPIQAGGNATLPIIVREWITLVPLPFSRIVFTRPVPQ